MARKPKNKILGLRLEEDLFAFVCRESENRDMTNQDYVRDVLRNNKNRIESFKTRKPTRKVGRGAMKP